jgi:hypothetical protein
MKKMILGVILGAVVFFAWGAVSWMALPFHGKTLKPLAEEALITDTLKVVVKEPGVYGFPFCDMKASKEEQAATMAKHKAGPIGILVFDPNGNDPMSPGRFLNSFLIGLIASIASMFILAFSRDRIQGLGARVLLLAGVGFMGWAVSDLMYWNWFAFPCDFVLANLLDWVVEFSLLGLVLHKFVPTYE